MATKLMNTPKSVDISITNRCNLRCKYCYHFESADDVDRDLPTDVWLSFFEELTRLAVLDVCLAGGEPFMREDLKELIEGVVKNRMRFKILTNGTLITDEMAAFIASTRRCDTVQVSIDGSTPITHDACRGSGNFAKAMEGLACLKRHNIAASVRVTIHRKNVHDLEGIARLLIDEVGLPGFSTNSAGYLGLCRKNAEQVQLTAEDRSTAMKTLLSLTERYNGRISAAAGPLAEGKGWLEMERARQEGREAMPGRGFLTGCGGTKQTLGIRADGVITPCSQLPHLEMGRIGRDGLREIWQHHPTLERIRERHTIPLTQFAFCEGCPYIPYCTGSCPALAYTIAGKDEHPAPDACLRLFLQEGGRLPEMV
jgi:SynChlorMet cassette radical SAM/SPASM protein ScmE